MNFIFKFFAHARIVLSKISRRIWCRLYRPLFKSCGNRVIFDPLDDFSYSTITLGNKVFIGRGAKFQASDSFINIGSNVLFGPNVVIMGGDHRFDVIGEYIYDVKEKSPLSDKGVTIADDVWVGANCTILKGVTIGKGSIVGAGAVVLKDIPEYSIYTTRHSPVIRPRWTSAQINEHERIIRCRETGI